MRFCWGKALFDVDADAEDAALKKVDDADDVPFRRRRRKRARDEMRDMMMMIRRDMNFCGGKILNCFYENHHRHKKYATGGNSRSRMDSRCTQRVLTGAALGGAVGGAVGACYGTYEAFAYKVRVLFEFARFHVLSLSLFALLSNADTLYVFDRLLSLCFFRGYTQIPGMLKVRHIGRTTMGSAGLFSLFLGAGSLLHCGRRS